MPKNMNIWLSEFFSRPYLNPLQHINLIPGFAATYTNDPVSYDIKIIGITGAVVKSVTSASPAWQDNLSGLLPGTYIIQVTNSSDNSLVGSKTFVKM
jgi:trimeric autotransporter adhesin